MKKDNNEIKRQSNVRARMVRKLREAGRLGLTNDELSKIAVRYGGTLGELYKRGYVIEKEHLGEGLYNYVLISEPETEKLDHKKAVDILIESVAEQGSVTAENLSWMIEELGLNVRRKANTYKNGALV
jgi:hypothetical protein